MNPETFFDNFGLLADTPDGVQKLRELILQLAVQGKLLPQDPNDEPATVLLGKIKAEKDRLVKEGKIKKIKVSVPVEQKEVPFDIPENWTWMRLGDLGITQTGTTPKKGDDVSYGQDFPFIKPADILPNWVNYDNYGLSKEGAIKCGRLAPSGSILMVCIGSIGKGNIIEKDCSFNQQINSLTPYGHLNSYLINYFLMSDYFQSEAWARSSRTTLAILNKGKWEQIPVPLPSLEEQHRIVAKVDQLMALCDELEARQQKKQESRLRLNSAALDKLLTAHEPDEFAHHWQRVCGNFDLLYDNPETVGELRKAILQLAVQGKLVRQDEDDEPAAVLLEKIKVETERLVKDGKIRKTKPLSSNDIENPYELPANWKWTRLFDIGVINPRNKASDDIDASFVPMTLISETYSTPVSSEKRLWGEIKTGFTHFAEEDVVLAKITPCFQNGKSAVMRGLLNGFGAGTTELHVFRPLLGESVYPDYVLLYLKSPQFLIEGIKKMTGTAGQKRVTRDYFAGNPFPLPPFEEQRRIVARVDQLMAFCDDLESKLNQSQTDGAKLMGAVVAELVGAQSQVRRVANLRLIKRNQPQIHADL